MIELKLVIIAVCSALNCLGGFSWHNARRFIMPVVLASAISFFTGVWWLGLTTLPSIGVLVTGYGEKSIFRHIFGDAWARFVWMDLVCVTLAVGPLLTGHLGLLWALPYCVLGGFLGLVLRNINQITGDFVFGSWFGLIVLLVH